MRQTARRLLGAAALLAVTTVTTGLLATAATAAPAQTAADPGDDRAWVYTGKNIDFGQDGNGCAAADLPGDEMVAPEGIYTSDGTYIDITAHPEGYKIVAVFVKGSNEANRYFVDPPAELEIEPLGDLPWLDLHSPLASSGKPAGLSHWFICVEKDTTTTTTTTTTTDATATTTTEATTTSPGTGDTTSVTATTTSAAAAGSNNDNLASTGFGSSWLLIVGLALVAAGAAFVASPKLRGLIKR
ncbi:hypothetical protein [Saccharothrix variisporea]|uniref:LPXTG-motif cell wall-anchored protein n=1 Tax=Saccharothrix variisporea TaxID=543527 RepID=A0A495X876_9PSEU|nr:hypothetical protein [Saccharothrix variisporea]RKT70390.1 LPXTG-motif cell wall-anchored protein [Saccharothrix variisporea]